MSYEWAHARKQAKSSTSPARGILQHKCDKCREKKGILQRAAVGSAPGSLPPVVHEALRSPGQPLDLATRAFMEPRFGHDFSRVRISASQLIDRSTLAVNKSGDSHEREADRIAAGVIHAPGSTHHHVDFSQVRVHTDERASKAAHAINAKAYAVGQDIVFGEGRYQPETPHGRQLIAHELAHVVQQFRTGPRLARAELDLNKVDLELFWGDPLTQDHGEIGRGATPASPDGDASLPIEAFVFPRNTSSTPQAAATPAAGTTPGQSAGAAAPETIPAPTPRQVSGDPRRSQWRPIQVGPARIFAPARRALIVAGIHGDEKGPLDLVKQLQSELRDGSNPLARDFDTIVIPSANPGGVQKGTRENLRGVDLNRNFPGLQGFPSLPKGQKAPPIQPEVKAIMKVVQTLRPDRILSLHAISEDTDKKTKHEKGGVYADPVEGMVARQLSCRMALRMRGQGDVNVGGNKLSASVCNVRYPETAAVSVTKEQSSLGAWASAPKSVGGEGIPVITHEVTGKQPLAATGAGRSVAAIMPGIREFLLDNEHLPSEADALLKQAVSDAFLTGEATTVADEKTRQAIESTVKSRFDDMNAYYKQVWRRQQPADVQSKLPATLSIVSGFRSFKKQAGIASGALTKEPLFKATNTDDEIKQAILNVMKTISVPGFSRHAWGTDIDLVSATRTDWEGSGKFVPLIPFFTLEATRFGFYHPYSDRRLSATLPHYENEPWHLSYWPIATALQEEYMKRITGTVLDNLIARTAKSIHGSIDETRIKNILAGMNLTSFQSNVAPPPK